MKFATVSKSLVMGAAMVLASSAFAANKANLTLNDPTTVNGTKLQAGEYKVEWDGNGPDVQLSIVKGKNVVAKVPAKIVELSSKASNDAAVLKANSDGTTSLAEARFAGKKFSLKIGEADDGMQAGSSR
ncbi:MAG TPA: hypothetical protein VGS27_32790 [Candidatus Sulfotelmatobacter sp.]|nr:hypothetical protein [Candidatus Sulfotelmatobacter sp.]